MVQIIPYNKQLPDLFIDTTWWTALTSNTYDPFSYKHGVLVCVTIVIITSTILMVINEYN